MSAVYTGRTQVPPAGYKRLGGENPLPLPLAPWVPYLPAGYQSQYSRVQPQAVPQVSGGFGDLGNLFEGVPGWGWWGLTALAAAAGAGAGYYFGRGRRRGR